MKFRRFLSGLLLGLGCVVVFIGVAATVLPMIQNDQLRLVLSSFEMPSQNMVVNAINGMMTYALSNCYLVTAVGAGVLLLGALMMLVPARAREDDQPRADARPAPYTALSAGAEPEEIPVWRASRAPAARNNNPFADTSLQEMLTPKAVCTVSGKAEEYAASSFAPPAASRAVSVESPASPYARPAEASVSVVPAQAGEGAQVGEVARAFAAAQPEMSVQPSVTVVQPDVSVQPSMTVVQPDVTAQPSVTVVQPDVTAQPSVTVVQSDVSAQPCVPVHPDVTDQFAVPIPSAAPAMQKAPLEAPLVERAMPESPVSMKEPSVAMPKPPVPLPLKSAEVPDAGQSDRAVSHSSSRMVIRSTFAAAPPREEPLSANPPARQSPTAEPTAEETVPPPPSVPSARIKSTMGVHH